MRATLLAALFVLHAAAGTRALAQAPQDGAKRDAIRALLRAQKTDSQMLIGMDRAMAQQTPDPSLPAGFMDSVLARARRNVGAFVEQLVPVYDSLFTAAEIAQLTAFYGSPVGRRLVAAQPALLQAATDIGQRWGMELAAQVMLDLSRQPTRKP